MADSRFLVIHGDDLGLTHSFNAGIREACAGGLLSSTSVRSNGAAFEEAVDQVIPACPDLGVGIHLNVVEGRTQRSSLGRSSRICDSQGYYKVSFGGLLWAHRNRDDTTFAEIQDDFRTQIEAVLARGIAPDHLSSHQHSHAVPSVFRIVCELAREYGIPFVRLVREAFYWAGSVRSHLGIWYPVNLLKHVLLNRFAAENRQTAESLGVRTNHYFVGLAYTGHMSTARLTRGLARLSPLGSGTVEVLLHPCLADSTSQEAYIAPYLGGYTRSKERVAELEALQDRAVRRFIEEGGWQMTSYRRLAGATV